MTNDILFNKIKEEMEKEFPDVLVKSTEAVKNNGIKYYGIAMVSNENEPAPVFWLNDLERQIRAGKMSLEESAKSIIESYKAAKDYKPQKPELDYESAKKKFFAVIVNTEKNREMLSDAPHKEIEDLSVVIRYGKLNESFLVTNDALNSVGITAREALDIAVQNTIDSEKIIHDMLDEMPEETRGNKKIFMISNNSMLMGAAIVFLDREARKTLRKIIGGDYYIVPSSIHECLIWSVEETDREKLKLIISDMNFSMQERSDVLSNSLYFVGEDLKIKTC